LPYRKLVCDPEELEGEPVDGIKVLSDGRLLKDRKLLGDPEELEGEPIDGINVLSDGRLLKDRKLLGDEVVVDPTNNSTEGGLFPVKYSYTLFGITFGIIFSAMVLMVLYPRIYSI
jgi:hypothetical protein